MYNNKLAETEQKQNNQNNHFVYDWSDFTILVVEDDIINFKVTESILRSTGIRVLHAPNGYKAIDYVHFNPQINLVVMDVLLPDISGFETTREILGINPLLPIIAQTTTCKELYIKAGCVDYINRPSYAKSLVKKMSKFLSNASYFSFSL